MSEVDRALCRKAAADCIELARVATDHDRRKALLSRALEWLKLAYSGQHAELERILGDFNEQQMDPGEQRGRSPMQRLETQQQPVRQQHRRITADDRDRTEDHRTGAAHYRSEARRCRERAAAESDPAVARQLHGFAKDYDTLAAMFELEPDSAPPPGHTPMTRQQVQQQQKTEGDE